MANETTKFLNKNDEEEKLVNYYKEILDGKTTPSIENQKKFLLQLLNTKISQLEPKTIRIKQIHYFLRISVMLLSGITTVILGLSFSGSKWWSANYTNTALCITAAVTFLSGMAVFWDTENYWIRNKIMLNKLKELRYEYVFFIEGDKNIQTSEIKTFLDKFLTNLGDEYWEKFLKDVNKSDQKI